MNTGFARLALLTAVLCSLTSTAAQATIFHPATDPIGAFNWSTNPAYSPAGSWYSDHPNTPSGDIGNQSPANVEAKLETPAWLGVPLTFVSGGACTNPINCTTPGAGNNGTWTYSGTAASVFGIHFGDNFLALLFAAPVTSFSIFGLPQNVSNIYAFNLTATPLPGALWLMASALAGWFGLTRWGRRRHSFRLC
jgi:hypothetical protein